jgi:hypothetical protein
MPTPSQQSMSDAFSLMRPRPKAIGKQIKEASVIAQPDASTISDLPKIVWMNKRFVIEAQVSKKRSRGRRSWIQAHGDFLAELNPDDSILEYVWACRACDEAGRPSFFVAQSTSSSIEHLKERHSVTEHSADQHPNQTVLELQATASKKRPARGLPSNVPRAKFQRIRELAVGYIINSDLPFSCFEDPYLSELLSQYDNPLAQEIALGRVTLSGELAKLFESKKADIRKGLDEALTSIHISFDLWTSPNHLAFIAIFAHFLNQAGQYQCRLLAFRRQFGTHSGENIAQTLEDVV